MQAIAAGLKRVSSSPHIRSRRTIQSIMLEVLIALIPTGVAGIIVFGWKALAVILVSTGSAVMWEALYAKMAKKPQTVSDLSAAVTGLLLAYNLPSSVPLWLPVVGTGLAIILVKQIFGGIGHNFVNPALAARAILMTSWVSHMSGEAYNVAVRGLDAVTTATPLAAQEGSYSLMQLFIGQCPGCIGEVSKLAILIGGLYLIARKIIVSRIPILVILTTFFGVWIMKGSAEDGLYQVLCGGLMLNAFFMATDYVTSPVTNLGRSIFAVGCGLLTFVIRAFSPMPGGTSYAVLVMNLAVPLIDRFTLPRVYGEVKRRA